MPTAQLNQTKQLYKFPDSDFSTNPIKCWASDEYL